MTTVLLLSIIEKYLMFSTVLYCMVLCIICTVNLKEICFLNGGITSRVQLISQNFPLNFLFVSMQYRVANLFSLWSQ